jgi:hypothetical protein
MIFYRKCIRYVTHFHISRPAMSQAVSCCLLNAEARVPSRSIPFCILVATKLHFSWFSPSTFHSPVSTLTLTLRTHTMTTVHTTQSHNSAPSLTETSVCVCLMNINKEPSQQVGVFYTESSGLVSGFNTCTSLRGQRRNWYIIITF